MVLLVEHEHVRVVRAVVHGVHAVVDRGHLEVLVDVEVLLAVDDLGLDELLALHLDLDGRRHRVEQEPAGRVEGEADGHDDDEEVVTVVVRPALVLREGLGHVDGERRVRHDARDVQHLEELLEDADVLRRRGHDPPIQMDERVAVRAHLHVVHQQRDERPERERRAEQHDVAVLDRRLHVVDGGVLQFVVLHQNVLELGHGHGHGDAALLLLPQRLLDERRDEPPHEAARQGRRQDDGQRRPDLLENLRGHRVVAGVRRGAVQRILAPPGVLARAAARLALGHPGVRVVLDEGQVEEGHVVVHEEEVEELLRERVVVLRLRAPVLAVRAPLGDVREGQLEDLNPNRVHDRRGQHEVLVRDELERAGLLRLAPKHQVEE